MITAIIQARMGSTRLPGKVLLPLGDTTVLGHTMRQVKKAEKIGKVIIATSTEKDDDRIEAYCKETGIEVFRGSSNDVLDRYYKAAIAYGAENIARITADCPLIDPAVIDRVATEYEKGECDYISTGRVISTFPDGMDTEIFSFGALKTAWQEAKLPSEREHVTTFIWNHPERFRVIEVKNDRDLSSVRVVLDEERDYQVIKKIILQVPELSMKSVVHYIEAHPEVAKINGSIVRDEGYFKSLKQDEEAK